MMGTTHALIGLLLGATTLLWAPEYLLLAGITGFIGGLFPDADMIFQHRKTLHFAEYYTAISAAMMILSVLAPSMITVGLLYFFLSAALHSWSDILGGGLETRPWKMTSDKALYLHTKDSWASPRHWIRYDGSPEDFLLGATAGLISLIIYGFEAVEILIYLCLGLSLIYTLVRKRLVEWAPDRFL